MNFSYFGVLSHKSRAESKDIENYLARFFRSLGIVRSFSLQSTALYKSEALTFSFRRTAFQAEQERPYGEIVLRATDNTALFAA